jgi:hypothetical protein
MAVNSKHERMGMEKDMAHIKDGYSLWQNKKQDLPDMKQKC